MRRVEWSALALAIIVAFPAALASWGGKGGFEPDTAYDLDFMWPEPDVDPNPEVRKIYFNGFSGAAPGLGTSINPNLARFQTAIVPAPFYPVAILGVWKDCNGDGYIGLGDNGALEYRSSLLSTGAICPPVTGASVPAYRIHNDGQWVQELVPIGYDDVRNEPTGGDGDPRNYNDTGARVWADWGTPESMPSPPCALTTMHRGTMHSTGGFLAWIDCHDRHYATQTWSGLADDADQPGLGFSDVRPDEADRSNSTLNQPNPYGDASDDAVVTVFDCSEPAETIAVSDPTGGGLHSVTVGPMTFNITDSEGRFFSTEARTPAFTPPRAGSPAGTVNETEAGLTDCDRSNEGEVVDLDGHADGSDAGLPYFLEGSTRAPSRFEPRSQSDFVLAFEEGDRRSGPASLTGRWSADANTGLFTITGMWSGTSATRLEPAAYFDSRKTGAAPVSFITYYAIVSRSLLELEALFPPAGASSGTYGSEACALPEPTFECDPAKWWRDEDGRDAMPRDARLGSEPGSPTIPARTPLTELGRRVGDGYTLRDVDCIDFSAGTARDAGVHWGALTDTTCVD